MVFKADDGAAATFFCAAENRIADHTGPGTDGIEVQSTDKITANAIKGFIILTKHLITAADRKNS